MPKIAVIIVNYKAGEHIIKCLDHLSRQTLAPEKVIVVDNGSGDGSPDIIETIYPWVILVRLNANAGFAAGNNIAAKMCGDCDYIALLNPDAFAAPDWLEKLSLAAANNPAYNFFGSRMLIAGDEERLDGVGDVYHASGLAWRRGHGSLAASVHMENVEIFGPCAAAAMYRTRDFLSVGGFDESYFCYFEDVDLAFRLRLAGGRCLYVADAVVAHVGSAITNRGSDFSVYHGHRNLVWTYVKNMPWPLCFYYLPQHILLNLVSVAVFVLKGQGGVILRAKIDAVAGLPRVFKERRAVQARRKTDAKSISRMIGKGFLRPYAKRD